MIIIGADWSDILSWNLRNAAALWAAWGGGISSAVYGVVRMQAPVRCEELLPGTEIDVDQTEERRPDRHLTLVD